ncbi:hypothetical protein D3C85_1281980 [compost metagenome]
MPSANPASRRLAYRRTLRVPISAMSLRPSPTKSAMRDMGWKNSLGNASKGTKLDQFRSGSRVKKPHIPGWAITQSSLPSPVKSVSDW